MKTRNLVAGGAGGLVLAGALANNADSVGNLAADTLGVVQWAGDNVANAVNAVGGAAFAATAAPFATAAGGLYLTNNALDWAEVDSIVARRLAQVASVVGGYTAGAMLQPLILGGAATVGLYKGAKFVWNKAAKKSATA